MPVFECTSAQNDKLVLTTESPGLTPTAPGFLFLLPQGTSTHSFPRSLVKTKGQCEQDREHKRKTLCPTGVYSQVGETY